jgi:CheY-like chemotaxis protein
VVLLVRTCTGRILDHLLDNAIKFTEAGSVLVMIKVEGEALVLSIEDTGVGIKDAFQPYLYDEFRQESTGNTRSYGGTGLGLAITKRMAELMGGSISVQSEKDKGSVFVVRFPVTLLRLPSEQPSPAQNGSTATRPLPRILAVEDSSEIEVLLSYILRENYSVDVAKNEQEAMAKVQGPPYDLVLMDINLGEQRTGVDIMQDLRCIPAYANVPIVAMTAYALLEDRDRFLEAGFDGYLSKPFTTKELLTLIEQMLSMGVRRKPMAFPVDKVRGKIL